MTQWLKNIELSKTINSIPELINCLDEQLNNNCNIKSKCSFQIYNGNRDKKVTLEIENIKSYLSFYSLNNKIYASLISVIITT